MESTTETLQRIESAAMDEFLFKGFQGASLRQIVKNAGVTTGAFYGYFSSKEALFAHLVEPHAKALMARYMDAHLSFTQLPKHEQPTQMGKASGDYIEWMSGYIMEHHDGVMLLIKKAEGTGYDHFIDNMVEVEVDSTIEYIKVLQQLGHKIEPIERMTIKIISTQLLQGLFEIMLQGSDAQMIHHATKQYRAFFVAGWNDLFHDIRSHG